MSLIYPSTWFHLHFFIYCAPPVVPNPDLRVVMRCFEPLPLHVSVLFMLSLWFGALEATGALEMIIDKMKVKEADKFTKIRSEIKKCFDFFLRIPSLLYLSLSFPLPPYHYYLFSIYSPEPLQFFFSSYISLTLDIHSLLPFLLPLTYVRSLILLPSSPLAVHASLSSPLLGGELVRAGPQYLPGCGEGGTEAPLLASIGRRVV